MPYHPPEAFRDAVEVCVECAGKRAVAAEIGLSPEGRPLTAVAVAAPGRTPNPERPQALVTANIHGVEVIGSEVALGLLERLTGEEPSGAAGKLLDVADVTVVPVLNPDGRARAFAASTAGRSPWRRDATSVAST